MYLLVKKSESLVDHCYDKLLHIGNPESVKMMNNEYLTKEATIRHQYIVDYVLEFGRTGILSSLKNVTIKTSRKLDS